MIGIGKGGKREIDDFMLTRYVCYLIAQNGDPRKEPIISSERARKLALLAPVPSERYLKDGSQQRLYIGGENK